MSDDAVERRQHKRVKVRAPVKVTASGRELKGELWNLSQGGALINLDESIETYSVVELTIPRLGSIKGAVLQGDPPCSLQFHNVSEERSNEIEAFLDRYELQRSDE